MPDVPSAILTYHSIDSSGSIISIAPDVFARQMDFLARSNTQVVELGAVQNTPGAVAITFDDGFRNFHRHALPILASYGFPATVFLVSRFIGGRNDWPSQPRSGVPLFELMDWGEIREAASCGIAFGAHTRTHPRLTQIALPQLDEEIQGSKADIEDRTGLPVTSFCYPYGDSNAEIRRAAERNFSVACSTVLDYVTHRSHRMTLPRLDVYYLQSRFWFERLNEPLGRRYIAARRQLRQVKTLV